MNSDNTKEAKAEECPDGLLPDGPTCPRCGGKRGPSGVDGGSWVHYRQAASRLAGQGEQPEDEKLLRRALYYLEADAAGRYGIKGLEEIVAAGDHPVVADLRKRLGGSARFPTASLTVPGDAPKGEQPAPAADEMEQYRRTLEVIAVGDAGDPITAAVNTLVATGFWDASAPAPAGDAPAGVSDEIERLLDQCLAYQAGVSSAIALEDAQDEADNRRLLAAAKGNLLTAVKAIRHKAIDDAVRVVGLQKGLK